MKVIEHIDNAKDTLFSFEIIPPKRGTSVQEIIDGPMWKWIDDNMSNMEVCIDKCGTKEKTFDTYDVEYQQKPYLKDV